MIRPPLLSLLLAALLAGGCDRATEPRPGEPQGGLCSIARLKSLCRGAAQPITEETIVRGRVVGNDRFGEFDRTLVVEDASGGIAVRVAMRETALAFPFGREVTVRCNGLVLCDYGGKIELGAAPGDYGAEAIPEERIRLHLRLAQPQPASPPQPLELSLFREIGPEHVDTYVRFTGVRFARGGTWCLIDPDTHRTVTTEHTLVDAEGGTLTLRCAGTALYAREPVPFGTGSLGCVVDRFGGRYSLRVTNCEALFVNAEAPPTAYP